MRTAEELEQLLDQYWSDYPAWRSADIGEGWIDLVYDLTVELAEKYPDFKITQIKEKFGGLRYYVEGYFLDFEGQSLAESTMYKMIANAEKKSRNTCEVTGKPGKVRDDLGWIITLSDEEYEKAKNRST